MLAIISMMGAPNACSPIIVLQLELLMKDCSQSKAERNWLSVLERTARGRALVSLSIIMCF